MGFVDLTNVNLYYGLAAGGGVVALLAAFAHSRGGPKVRASAAVVAAVGGLGAGLALGVILMGLLGYRTKAPEPPAPGSPGDPRTRMAAGGPGPGRGRGGRGGQASAKVQLANLVGKIHLLTGKPLALRLSDEQRRKVREQLAGLDQLEDLGEEDAQKRFDSLLTTLGEDKETLDAVNYRWSRPGGAPGLGGSPPPPANPFREGTAREQVQSLQKRLEPQKGAAEGP